MEWRRKERMGVGFARRTLLLVAAVVVEAGCATLGGTTRHVDEATVGPSVIAGSERLPARDRLEITADIARGSPAIRARVSHVLACRVLQSAPRVVTTTTTQAANRLIFAAEMTLSIVGLVITGAAASSAAKACPNGNPDTCDISKATALLSGVVTAPFVVSAVADLVLTGGTQRTTRASVVTSVRSEHVGECGREPLAHARAKLALPDGEVLEQASADDGSLLFELTADQLTRLGPTFEVELFVAGALPGSTSIRVGE